MPSELLNKRARPLEELQRLSGGGNLWAVVDACDEPAVPPKCEQLGDRAVSLYRGRPRMEYADIAPYLIRLDASTLDWIRSTLWTRPWGMFIYAQADQHDLRNHLRRFLKVRFPDGKVYFFRFYDPAILVAFLESSNSEELAEFYGPVRAYGISAGADGLFYQRA